MHTSRRGGVTPSALSVGNISPGGRMTAMTEVLLMCRFSFAKIRNTLRI
jgi:hypothetical protein